MHSVSGGLLKKPCGVCCCHSANQYKDAICLKSITFCIVHVKGRSAGLVQLRVFILSLLLHSP
jgi:hypothetical protein